MNEMRHPTHGRAIAARLRGTTRMAALFVLTAVLGVTGFLAASAFAGGAGSQSNATLSLRQTNLGQILVSAKGRTLYSLHEGQERQERLQRGCASYWPPLVKTGKLTVGPGVKQSLVGTTKRADGRLQVTYKKHPLYTFALDKRAGSDERPGQLQLRSQVVRRLRTRSAVLKAPTTTTTDTTTTTTTTPYPPYP